ncbi:MAG: hypothetical protein QM736_00575 [Vicinamibacterales bacterium]
MTCAGWMLRRATRLYGRGLKSRNPADLRARVAPALRIGVGEVGHIREDEPDVRITALNRRYRAAGATAVDELQVHVRHRAGVFLRERNTHRRFYRSHEAHDATRAFRTNRRAIDTRRCEHRARHRQHDCEYAHGLPARFNVRVRSITPRRVRPSRRRSRRALMTDLHDGERATRQRATNPVRCR